MPNDLVQESTAPSLHRTFGQSFPAGAARPVQPVSATTDEGDSLRCSIGGRWLPRHTFLFITAVCGGFWLAFGLAIFWFIR